MARLPGLKAQIGVTPSAISDRESRSDLRNAAALAEASEHVGLRDDVRGALPGCDEAQLAAIVSDLAKLGGLARAVRGQMVDMGRALLRLQATAGPGGYKALFKAGLVPVPETLAGKLRMVAQAVDDGRLSPERLPRSVQAAWAAAKLDPLVLCRLVADKVLRPEATAQEIHEAARTPASSAKDAPLVPAERRRLERRLARLEAEAERIRRRLGR